MVPGNFNTLELRQDSGALWENFLMSKRMKQNIYKSSYAKMYFWRTTQQQEVDLVEEKNGELTGFEFKCPIPDSRLSKNRREPGAERG